MAIIKKININNVIYDIVPAYVDSALSATSTNPVQNNVVNTALNTKAAKPTIVTVTLSASNWSNNAQTVTVSGVSATETAQMISVAPAASSMTAYMDAGVVCVAQAANSLIFNCDTVPTSNLTVYVSIQGVG